MRIFNCQKVSRLVTRSQEQNLSIIEAVEVRLHLMMCRHCARFDKQLKIIREFLQKAKDESMPLVRLEGREKQKLKNYLSDFFDKSGRP